MMDQNKKEKQNININKWSNVFKEAFPHTIPVLTGFMVLGIAYGILVSTKGYNPLWTLAFSAFCFCGSMQFVAIPFMVGQFQPLHVFLLALMVNARHLFYGLSMLSKYSGTGKFKFFITYTMCDETFAINSITEVPEGMDKGRFYFAVSFMDWSYWCIAGVIGNVIGSLITINTNGLDFALTALFIVLFIEQIKSNKKAICGIIGVVGSIIAIFIFGTDNMVIPSMIIILTALLIGQKGLSEDVQESSEENLQDKKEIAKS